MAESVWCYVVLNSGIEQDVWAVFRTQEAAEAYCGGSDHEYWYVDKVLFEPEGCLADEGDD